MAKKQTKSATMPKKQVVTQIIREFKDMSRAEIKRWRDALAAAGDVEMPRVYLLQDMYDNLESDGHYMSQMLLRKAATTGYGFSVYDKKSGAIDAEKSALFQAEWFYDFVENVLDSVYKGYTLLELTDPATMQFSLIPRRNVVGIRQIVLTEVGEDKGIDISKGFERTLIKVGQPTDLGLMAHLCGLLIWKRNAQQSWADFTERFGMPLISATTNKSSKRDIDEIDRMLSALGESATAVLPEGTTLKIDPFTGGDSYMVYDAQIKRINSEMSKPIVGGTMMTDDGSSRSQAEVHERNLDDKIAATDRRMVEFVVNTQLLAMMQSWGWNVNPETDRFQFDTAFELTLKEHWDIVRDVMGEYEVDTDWLSKTFNVPILGLKKKGGDAEDAEDNISASFR